MKTTVLFLFTFFLSHNFVSAQNFTESGLQDSTGVKIDSVQTIKKNAVIQTIVNKDGVTEITRKEFDKIPAARQELIKKDKNFKIID